MCGRYTLTRELADWTGYSGYHVPDTCYVPRYNIAPGQYAPVVVLEEKRRTVRLMRWGLVPFWAKDEKIAFKTINARSESLSERASYKHALKRRRCLVIADGFYEWRKTEGGKQPHYIYLSDRRVFSFAGLWERWDRADVAAGEPGSRTNPLLTFTIVTTEPNDFMAGIHNRMPVILRREDEERWLDGGTAMEDLQELLVPFTAERLAGHEVGRNVGNVRNECPELIEPRQSQLPG